MPTTSRFRAGSSASSSACGRPRRSESSDRRCSSSTRRAASAGRTRCRPSRRRCAGPPSSARPSTTRPCCSSATSSSGTDCATTSSFEESEDHDLWSRLLEHTAGANVPEPLVLYRVHGEQASQRRRELQRECQLRVARAAIARIAPGLSEDEVDLAWQVGAAEAVSGPAVEAADAYVALLDAFEERFGRGARPRAARDLARVAAQATVVDRARVARQALRLDPALPASAVARRRERGRDRAGTPRGRGLADAPRGRRGRRADPRRGGLPGADAVPDATPRPDRGTPRDRSHGPLRRPYRRRANVADRPGA